MTKILSIQNAKTIKSIDHGYLTGIIYLKPDKNLCPNATKECLKHCLVNSGRGKFKKVKDARLNRTKLFKNNLDQFMSQLVNEIKSFIKKAKKKNLTPVIRLNGTSDIDYSKIINHKTKKNIFEYFNEIQFYDYTKNHKDLKRLNKISNYHLTYSFNERTTKSILIKVLKTNNVARINELHKYHVLNNNKYNQIDGDNHDLRFLDRSNSIINLKLKK
ncbi:MAG: hypothetical protein GTN36_05425 [Candidatus Aenigmarchaeota archaeon]|nr:hypothetical protein [Candidatus Aenigmarchaeota archaeon]